MNWLKIVVLMLALDRGLMILWAMFVGGRAALREMRRPALDALPPVGGIGPGPYPFWQSRTTTTTMPDQVEIASDEPVALDYSSAAKRH